MHSLTSTVKLVRPYLVLYIAQRELCRGAEGEGGGGRREEEEEEEGERGRREVVTACGTFRIHTYMYKYITYAHIHICVYM